MLFMDNGEKYISFSNFNINFNIMLYLCMYIGAIGLAGHWFSLQVTYFGFTRKVTELNPETGNGVS